MSPDFRKVALIAATLGLLVSLFVALRPDGDEDGTATTPATATDPAATDPVPTAPKTIETEPETEKIQTEPEPTVPPAPPPDEPVTIRIDVAADSPPNVPRYSVRRGREVVLVVRSELTDHVHLHGYDLFADVAPGQPGRIEFTADAPGLFEIELEERHLRIANLEVRP